MKVTVRKGQWFISFKETVLICDISKVEDEFLISFESKAKRVTLHTRNLDKTFQTLEEIYDRKLAYKTIN